MKETEVYLLSILTLITIAIWITFDVYKKASSAKISSPTEKEVQILLPSFDTNLLEELQSWGE